MTYLISLLIGEKEYESRPLINVSELGKPKQYPAWRHVLGWVLIYAGFLALCFGAGIAIGVLTR